MDRALLTERHLHAVSDGRRVVCEVAVPKLALQALLDAIAWRRRQLAATVLEDVEAVMAARAVSALGDRLSEIVAGGPTGPLTLDQDDTAMLCELANGYVAERDFSGHTSPEERARVQLLTDIGGPLMDIACELCEATEQVASRALLA